MNANASTKVAALPYSARRLCLSDPQNLEVHREAMPRARPMAHRSLLTGFFLLLTAHCSLLTSSAATWTRQSSGTMAWLHSVYFLDQNHGWVTGSNGTLLETSDGGTSCKRLYP